ncbi:hypothetical protein B0H15DRAFT_802083 [Mycena belliarum]|uniref:Zn(2)-C6 fungal-type domain-containing protein n=1 Tax=Mycena belliarum TaxID=1033014 RepID=A0AAD6U1G0_9AGAR|nr:hypothetical protein B0H15DRAFT_802083 [Mycena belliae]
MSNYPRPAPAMEAFTQPRRIYIACLNCRARKVKCISPEDGTSCARCTKKGVQCEYLAVPEEHARSAAPAPRPGGQKIAQSATPSLYPSPAWNHPQGYAEASSGQSVGRGYYPSQNAPQFPSGSGGAAPAANPNRPPPPSQYPTGGSRDLQSHSGCQPQPQFPYPPPGVSHQQPGASEWPSGYVQYLETLEYNAPSGYSSQMNYQGFVIVS